MVYHMAFMPYFVLQSQVFMKGVNMTQKNLLGQNGQVKAVFDYGPNENNTDALGELALTFTNQKSCETQNVSIDIMPWGIMIFCENAPFGVRIDGSNYITINLQGV
jgi:hypothetical protein